MKHEQVHEQAKSQGWQPHETHGYMLYSRDGEYAVIRRVDPAPEVKDSPEYREWVNQGWLTGVYALVTPSNEEVQRLQASFAVDHLLGKLYAEAMAVTPQLPTGGYEGFVLDRTVARWLESMDADDATVIGALKQVKFRISPHRYAAAR